MLATKCFPRNPVIASDDDWGAQSPPKSKVFRFHYHSEKVIGSLGFDVFGRKKFDWKKPKTSPEVMLLEFEMSGRRTGSLLGLNDGAFYHDHAGLFQGLGRGIQGGRSLRE